MQTFTYGEIREKALKQGIADNKLRIGLWANSNGYIKSKRKIQGKVITVYLMPQYLLYQKDLSFIECEINSL